MKRLLFLALVLLSAYTQAQPLRPANGYALLVGVTTTQAKSFKGLDFDPNGTVAAANDARAMHQHLLDNGFLAQNIILLDTPRKTVADSILTALDRIQKKAKANDLVVFYFSGHGDQRPENLASTSRDEADTLDEMLVAADRPIIDDELQPIWTRFGQSVRLLMIADACHSGTMMAITDFPVRRLQPGFDPFLGPIDDPGTRVAKEQMEAMPKSKQKAAKAEFSEKLRFRVETDFQRTATRSNQCLFSSRTTDEPYQMIYLGASYDHQLAQGGSLLSLFTDQLLFAFSPNSVLKGIFDGYETWADLATSCTTVVNYAELGPVSDAYRKSRPFAINNF
jgi:Caspase domain